MKAVVTSLVVFALLMLVNIGLFSNRIYRLPVARMQKAEQTCYFKEDNGQGIYKGVDQVLCGCPAANTQIVGFPFRADAYDACSQDSNAIGWIQLLNTGIIAIFSIGVYLLVSSIITKHPKAKQHKDHRPN